LYLNVYVPHLQTVGAMVGYLRVHHGQITYDLRRLRLHGLIERIPKTHRYRITAKGLRIAPL
jgi:DNA-binding PadR family transcriptional regulator